MLWENLGETANQRNLADQGSRNPEWESVDRSSSTSRSVGGFENQLGRRNVPAEIVGANTRLNIFPDIVARLALCFRHRVSLRPLEELNTLSLLLLPLLLQTGNLEPPDQAAGKSEKVSVI